MPNVDGDFYKTTINYTGTFDTIERIYVEDAGLISPTKSVVEIDTNLIASLHDDNTVRLMDITGPYPDDPSVHSFPKRVIKPVAVAADTPFVYSMVENRNPNYGPSDNKRSVFVLIIDPLLDGTYFLAAIDNMDFQVPNPSAVEPFVVQELVVRRISESIFLDINPLHMFASKARNDLVVIFELTTGTATLYTIATDGSGEKEVIDFSGGAYEKIDTTAITAFETIWQLNHTYQQWLVTF